MKIALLVAIVFLALVPRSFELRADNQLEVRRLSAELKLSAIQRALLGLIPNRESNLGLSIDLRRSQFLLFRFWRDDGRNDARSCDLR